MPLTPVQPLTSGKGAVAAPLPTPQDILDMNLVPTITNKSGIPLVSAFQSTLNAGSHLINGFLKGFALFDIGVVNTLTYLTTDQKKAAAAAAAAKNLGNPNLKIGSGVYGPAGGTGGGGGGGGSSTPIKLESDKTGINKEYNLPPHITSLPVSPQTVGGTTVAGALATGSTNAWSKGDPGHTSRRGRMWTYGGIAYDSKNTASGSSAYNYGFQFLWNPTDININVHRNQDMVPASADFLKSMYGNFQGQESIQFSIVLDRTNDFAALRGMGVTGDASGFSSIGNHYRYQYGSIVTPLEEKAMELLLRGTDHDIEYFFRMINGKGGTYTEKIDSSGNAVENTQFVLGWQNALGRKTSDTAYLAPSLIAVVFGPDPTENLSYIGYIETVNIKHTAFTENMIPIRSQLDINMVAFTVSATS